MMQTKCFSEFFFTLPKKVVKEVTVDKKVRHNIDRLIIGYTELYMSLDSSCTHSSSLVVLKEKFVKAVGKEMPVGQLWREQEFKFVDGEEELRIASSLIVLCRNCSKKVTLDKYKVSTLNTIGTP
jgi:hypothetical protein